MKNILKKLILLVLMVSFILGAVACNDDSDSSGESSTSTSSKVDYTTGIDFDGDPMKIVENGSNKYSIIVSSTAPTIVNSVAIELNDYVTSVSGAKLNIINDSVSVTGNYISLGDTKQFNDSGINISNIKNDGFVIKSIDGNIFINSNMDEGVMFGVYSFLERFLGIRWLTESATHIPKSDNINVYPCDIVEEPEFARRVWYDNGSAYESFYNHRRYFEDLNSWYYPGWQTPHNSTDYLDVSKHSIGYVNKYDVVDATTGKFIKKYTPDLNENEKYLYQYHPEYFTDMEYTFENGEVKPAVFANGDYDICFTSGINEDGTLKAGDSPVQYIVDKIKAALTEDAEAHNYKLFHIGEMDNAGALCQCKTCIDRRERYQGGGVIVMFINAIEREVNTWLEQEQGRTVTFSTFAYHTSVNPPVVKDGDEYKPIADYCIANENVQVRLAPIGADYTYSFQDENQIEKFKELFDGWDVCTTEIRVWDYVIDFYMKTWWYPNLHYLKENFMYYQEHGCVEVFDECSRGSGSPSFWTNALKSYVVSKLYWDFGWDVDELVNEFIELYYGEAAPAVKNYLNILDGHYAELRATKGSLGMEVVTPGCAFYYADKYPLNLMTGLISIVENEIVAITDNTNLSQEEIDTTIYRLEMLKITPMAMIWKNFDSYYNTRYKQEFTRELLILCEEYGVKTLDLNVNVADLKGVYGLE